jgi:heme O synthase-like polyprenyltransferase
MKDMDPLFVWFMLHGLTTVTITGQVFKVSDLDIDSVMDKTITRILQCL